VSVQLFSLTVLPSENEHEIFLVFYVLQKLKNTQFCQNLSQRWTKSAPVRNLRQSGVLSRNHNEFSFHDIFCYTLFSRGDKVLAVASMGPGNAVAKAANEMFEGKMRSASEIR